MPVNTYDPKKVIISLGGVPITGYADGTFVTIDAPNDLFTSTSGADGNVSRTKSNDYRNEVTITLKQSSLSNDYINSLAELDRIANIGARPLQINDLSGTTLFFWDAVWVQTYPSVEFGKEEGERAWVFGTTQAVARNVGGNF